MSTATAVPARHASTTQAQGWRAGVASRLIAAVIDLFVAQGAFAVVLFGFELLRYVLFGGSLTVPRPARALAGGGEWLVITAYLAVGWATAGRTVGAGVMGLRVVRANGERLPPGRAVVRAGLCAALPVLLLWALVSRRNAGLHDLLLGTAVIYDWGPRAPG